MRIDTGPSGAMRMVWITVGGAAGCCLGAALGIVVALCAMSLGPSRSDGTYGMREMAVCLPAGLLLGLLAGIVWGVKTRLAGP